MTTAEALAVLKKDAEEDRNWRSARSKLAEVLEAAMTADATWQTCCAQKAPLCASVAALERQRDELQLLIRAKQTQLAGFDAALTAKEAGAVQQIAAVQAQVAEARAELATIHSEFDALKSKLHR